MKIIAPDYYKEFHCIADKCHHSCCVGWEIDIDEESLQRFQKIEEIQKEIAYAENPEEMPHFRLMPGERCPFLQENGLCRMICHYGEEILCQICADHPRFRNFWEDRIELGLGLVCEEAARIILEREKAMRLEVLEDDDEEVELPDEEAWLLDLRQQLMDAVEERGPLGRLREYLLYRHLSNALYDDRVEERIQFVDAACRAVRKKWMAEKEKSSQSAFACLLEIIHRFSYDVEYDEEFLEEILEHIAAGEDVVKMIIKKL